jgi:hypothetical protein
MMDDFTTPNLLHLLGHKRFNKFMGLHLNSDTYVIKLTKDHTGLIGSKSFQNYTFKGWLSLKTMKLWLLVQWNLDLRKPDLRKNLDLRKILGVADFLVHKLFDLRKIF